jgi:hypothetical protein
MIGVAYNGCIAFDSAMGTAYRITGEEVHAKLLGLLWLIGAAYTTAG